MARTKKPEMVEQKPDNDNMLMWYMHPESDCAFIDFAGTVKDDLVVEIGDVEEGTVREFRNLLVAQGWNRRDTKDIDVNCTLPGDLEPAAPPKKKKKKSRRTVQAGDTPARYSGDEWPKGGYVRITPGLEDTCPGRQIQFEPPNGAYWVCTATCLDCELRQTNKCQHYKRYEEDVRDRRLEDTILFKEREHGRGD